MEQSDHWPLIAKFRHAFHPAEDTDKAKLNLDMCKRKSIEIVTHNSWQAIADLEDMDAESYADSFQSICKDIIQDLSLTENCHNKKRTSFVSARTKRHARRASAVHKLWTTNHLTNPNLADLLNDRWTILRDKTRASSRKDSNNYTKLLTCCTDGRNRFAP
jgi:hypothetical protein